MTFGKTTVEITGLFACATALASVTILRSVY